MTADELVTAHYQQEIAELRRIAAEYHALATDLAAEVVIWRLEAKQHLRERIVESGHVRRLHDDIRWRGVE